MAVGRYGSRRLGLPALWLFCNRRSQVEAARDLYAQQLRLSKSMKKMQAALEPEPADTGYLSDGVEVEVEEGSTAAQEAAPSAAYKRALHNVTGPVVLR